MGHWAERERETGTEEKSKKHSLQCHFRETRLVDAFKLYQVDIVYVYIKLVASIREIQIQDWNNLSLLIFVIWASKSKTDDARDSLVYTQTYTCIFPSAPTHRVWWLILWCWSESRLIMPGHAQALYQTLYGFRWLSTSPSSLPISLSCSLACTLSLP